MLPFLKVSNTAPLHSFYFNDFDLQSIEFCWSLNNTVTKEHKHKLRHSGCDWLWRLSNKLLCKPAWLCSATKILKMATKSRKGEVKLTSDILSYWNCTDLMCWETGEFFQSAQFTQCFFTASWWKRLNFDAVWKEVLPGKHKSEQQVACAEFILFLDSWHLVPSVQCRLNN